MSSSSAAASSWFIPSILQRTVILPFSSVDHQVHNTIVAELRHRWEGKCVKEGWIQPGSIKLQSHNMGYLDGDSVQFTAVFACQVFFPVVGQICQCTIVDSSKAGLRAEVEGLPFVIHIIKDYCSKQDFTYYQSLQKGDTTTVQFVDILFELNDTNISALSRLSRN